MENCSISLWEHSNNLHYRKKIIQPQWKVWNKIYQRTLKGDGNVPQVWSVMMFHRGVEIEW
jgi:hypothetical protein